MLSPMQESRCLAGLSGQENFRFVQGDICIALIDQLLQRSIDTVAHFAAESHVDRSILDQLPSSKLMW